jgi:hypothetical protein
MQRNFSNVLYRHLCYRVDWSQRTSPPALHGSLTVWPQRLWLHGTSFYLTGYRDNFRYLLLAKIAVENTLSCTRLPDENWSGCMLPVPW